MTSLGAHRNVHAWRYLVTVNTTFVLAVEFCHLRPTSVLSPFHHMVARVCGPDKPAAVLEG